MKLIEWSAQNPVFSNLLMLFILFSGITAVNNLQKEVFPSSSENKIEITMLHRNAQAQEIQDSICIKIEEALQNVAEINLVESIIQEGTVKVICTLPETADAYQVVNEVQLQVDSITSFPSDAEPPQVKVLTRWNSLIQLFVIGEMSEMRLKNWARIIKEDIANLSGVEDVVWRGANEEQIHIQISEQTINKYGIAFADIAQQIRAKMLKVSSGNIQNSQGEIDIYVDNLKYHAQDYEKIPIIQDSKGTQILLGEVATITEEKEKSAVIYRFNGKRAIQIEINSPKNMDSIELARKITQYTKEKRAELPPSVELVIWQDLSSIIQKNSDFLWNNAMVGFVFVIICLSFFLRLKLSFWISCGIPISFCGGFWVIWLSGGTLNNFSFFGLIMVLGMVVDDAIVVGENIQSHHDLQTPAAAIVGAQEVIPPVLLAIITTVITFLPLFFIPGTIGVWVSQIAVAIIAVLFFSTIECLFILPSHLKHLSSTTNPIRRMLNKIIDYVVISLYAPLYKKALQFSFIAIAFVISICIICISLLQGGHVKVTFFPQIDNEYVSAFVEFPPGTPKHQIEEALQHIEKRAWELNDHFQGKNTNIVKNMYSITNNNTGEIWIHLCEAEQRTYLSGEIVEQWQKTTSQIPGALSVSFGGYDFAPGGKAIEIHLFCDNPTQLYQAAKEIQQEISLFEGVYNVNTNASPGKFVLSPILTNKGKLLGITESDLVEKLSSGFSGKEIFKVQRGSEEVKVKIQYQQTQNLDTILIANAQGQNIPLSEIVEWEVSRGWAKINRRQKKQTITIYADVNDKVTTADRVIAELEKSTLPEIKTKYPDVKYNLGGQYEENQKSLHSLLISFQYSLISIFILLALFFRSYLQPLLIFAILPLGAIGAIFGHWMWNMPLSIMSIFGIFALCGILINDALVLLHAINSNIQKGLTVKDALIEAGLSRFRAIILTSVTTFFGLLPLLFETSFFATPIIQMALSIGFGLLFGTFLTLFLMPTLFWYLNTTKLVSHWLATGKWVTRESLERK